LQRVIVSLLMLIPCRSWLFSRSREIICKTEVILPSKVSLSGRAISALPVGRKTRSRH
jgi:hypothetical protein